MTICASVYIATSLDGFISRKDGSIDWLMDANATVPQGEDCGYAAFMSTVDVLIMGRNTYEQIAGFDKWPYEGMRVVVLTSRKIEFRQGPHIRLESSSETPQKLLKRLSSEGHKHAYIDGGKVIQNFLSNSLINQLTINLVFNAHCEPTPGRYGHFDPWKRGTRAKPPQTRASIGLYV